jgi:hypothetical protein
MFELQGIFSEDTKEVWSGVNMKMSLRFQVLMVVHMKITSFWVIVPHGLI